jgi:hypothetical protein
VVKLSPSKETKNKDACGDEEKPQLKVRLSMVLRAETARKLLELRSRGVIRSYADGVNQAILLFYDKILEQDLCAAHLRVIKFKRAECDEHDVS